MHQELKQLEAELFESSKWQDIVLTKEWAMQQPEAAGVYIIFEKDIPIYVGESKNLSNRAENLLNTRQHTARRTLGEKRLYTVAGFKPASTKNKFPNNIEKLVNEILQTFKICFLPVSSVDRKELKKYIITTHKPELNKQYK